MFHEINSSVNSFSVYAHPRMILQALCLQFPSLQFPKGRPMRDYVVNLCFSMQQFLSVASNMHLIMINTLHLATKQP